MTSGRSLVARLVPLLLALLATAPDAVSQSPTGTIRGQVVDADFEMPLPDVGVTVLVTRQRVQTSSEGTFLIGELPPGRYALSLAKPGYMRRLVTDIAVAPGGVVDLRIVLESEVTELDELLVTGIDLDVGTDVTELEVRAASVNVQDTLSADAIARSGASDVAGALRFVVGTSVAAGKYATVRGLSDRYTGTTLNGIRLPSADPRRRAFQLDLLPTATIEGISVTKTFTPDLQGDFTGGGVDIRTKSVPAERLLMLGFAIECDSRATGSDRFLSYRGGGVNLLGFAGSEREIPAIALREPPTFPTFSASPSQEQVDASAHFSELTRSFAPAMGVDQEEAGPNLGMTGAAGNSWTMKNGLVLGAIGAMTWQRKHRMYENGRNDTGAVSAPGDPITILSPRSDDSSTAEVLLGGLAALTVRPRDRDEITLRWIGNHSAEDTARLQVKDPDQEVVEQNQSLYYVERSLSSLQLTGAHEPWRRAERKGGPFRGLKLAWIAASSGTRQWEPDVRFFRNSLNTTTMAARRPSNSTDAQNTRRIFRDMTEDGMQYQLDLQLPFHCWKKSEGSIKLGAYRQADDRRFDQSSFAYVFPQQFGSITNPAVQRNRSSASWRGTVPEELWTDVFTDWSRTGQAPPDSPAPNQLLWTLTPLGTDVNYTGDQQIDAAYLMGDVPLHPRVRLVLGARLERTRISVVPVNEAFGTVEIIEVQPGGARGIVVVPQEEAVAEIEDERLLPAAAVTWEIRDRLQLRAAWSRTIARPTFRELAPIVTEEFLFGDEFLGNPGLEISRIENWDLRAEWFHHPGRVVAASVFRKHLADPIEYLSLSASNRSFVQPVNFNRGTVRGIEVEATASLGDFGLAKLKDLALGFNASILEAEVDVPPAEQESLAAFGLDESERRLQGQPEHLVNFSVTWESGTHGMAAGAHYTLTGDMLLTGAARGVEDGRPNVFERGSGKLDLSFERQFRSGLKLTVRAKNVLEEPTETYYLLPDGDSVDRTASATSRQVSIGASYTW